MCNLLNGAILNDLEWPLTQISRSWYYLTSNNYKMVQVCLHTTVQHQMARCQRGLSLSKLATHGYNNAINVRGPRLSFQITFSDLAKYYLMTWSISLDSWRHCDESNPWCVQVGLVLEVCKNDTHQSLCTIKQWPHFFSGHPIKTVEKVRHIETYVAYLPFSITLLCTYIL